MPNYATAEQENGHLYRTAGDALMSATVRHRKGELVCDHCDWPILPTSQNAIVISIYPERGGWNYDVLHTACDAPALRDNCDGQAVEETDR